jgi:hypothetical protein
MAIHALCIVHPASIIGGCCGTTREHIKAIGKVLARLGDGETWRGEDREILKNSFKKLKSFR